MAIYTTKSAVANGVSPLWIKQVTTALSRRYDVQIKEGTSWAMQPEKKILTYNPKHLLALDRDTVLGILLHELGHLHHTTTDWADTSGIYKDSPDEVFPTVNALEDIRINERMSRSYQGSRDLIDAMNELLGGQGVDSLHRMSKEISVANANRSNYSSTELQEILYITMNKIMGIWRDPSDHEYYDQRKLDIADELTDQALEDNLKEFDSTEQIHDFIQDKVWPAVADYLAPSLPKGSGGTPDPNGDEYQETDKDTDESSAESTGDSSTDDSQDDEAESSSSDGTEEESEGDDSDSSNSGGSGNTEPDEKTDTQDTGSGKKATPQGVGNHPHGFDQDDFNKEIEQKVKDAIKRGRINPDDENRVDPFTNRRAPRTRPVDSRMDFERYEPVAKPLIKRFKNKFRAVFRDNKMVREIDGQKSGRVNTRKLYKFGVHDTKLFTKPTIKNDKSYSITFLTDVSGSMGYDRLESVFSSLMAFCNLLQDIDIRYAVGFFGHNFAIGKKFTDKKLNLKELSLQASQVDAGGTDPSGLIKELLIKQLGNEKTEVKIGIMLTDGSWYENDYEILRKFRKTNPNVHLYLIGLSLYEGEVENVRASFADIGTFIHADTPADVMQEYYEIAKRHLT